MCSMVKPIAPWIWWGMAAAFSAASEQRIFADAASRNAASAGAPLANASAAKVAAPHAGAAPPPVAEPSRRRGRRRQCGRRLAGEFCEVMLHGLELGDFLLKSDAFV